MADGSQKKNVWRNLGPDMDKPVSPDLASVLVLHHLELAAAYFGALDLEFDGEDSLLACSLKSNTERFQLVMQHLERRYTDVAGNEDFKAAVPAFLLAINAHWEAVWRDEYGPGTDVGDEG